jgi:hypothetical protein
MYLITRIARDFMTGIRLASDPALGRIMPRPGAHFEESLGSVVSVQYSERVIECDS